jgi:hypothetical protein
MNMTKILKRKRRIFKFEARSKGFHMQRLEFPEGKETKAQERKNTKSYSSRKPSRNNI